MQYSEGEFKVKLKAFDSTCTFCNQSLYYRLINNIKKCILKNY